MNILSSFEVQDELNEKIWMNPRNPKVSKMIDRVRLRLLEIAYEFQEYLDVDIIISDVHMTGSLANFNWSEYSDIDLHLIVDFNQISEDQLSLYQNLFKLKKTIFNLQHNIKIFGFDVELYVQDINEEHTSTGVYSVLHDNWVVIPKKENPDFNKSLLEKKIESWKEKIDGVLEDIKTDDLETSKDKIGKLKEKIKEYRSGGLKKGGEFSYENLVFKYLRRSGYIEKLFDKQIEKTDKELSLKELRTN